MTSTSRAQAVERAWEALRIYALAGQMVAPALPGGASELATPEFAAIVASCSQIQVVLGTAADPTPDHPPEAIADHLAETVSDLYEATLFAADKLPDPLSGELLHAATDLGEHLIDLLHLT